MDRRRRWPVNRWSHGAGTLVCALALGASPGTARASECQDYLRAKDLVRIITEGDTAFSALDDETFASARREAVKSVQCLEEPLSPGQAALLHKLQALGAFVDRDDAAAVASFHSLVLASPGYALPDSLAPEGHPLRTHFAVAEGMVVVPGAPLPTPKSGRVHVDGRPATAAPQGRPWVFQHIDDSGAVLGSALVASGEGVPEYANKGLPVEPGARRGLNRPLAVTSGVAALASGALYLSARGTAAQFWEPTTPTGQLDGLRDRTNTLGWLSAGAGVVAVGAGAGAFIAGTF